MSQARWQLTVEGVVQGVGFRPFVYRLASGLGLSGWVRNDSAGVTIEVQGPLAALGQLRERLQAEHPPLARIDRLVAQDIPCQPNTGFEIRLNQAGSAAMAVIAPDSAVCQACLAELFEPANRRWRYPFINCTDCGPRYTLVRHLPYERAATSMAAFCQCPRCQREYDDPGHRRFHAEPNACPDCGPQVRLVDRVGQPLPGDAITAALALLQQGKIVAIKGLGGFHLACDASKLAAVARLRQLKARAAKPFAVMLANLASLASWVEPDPAVHTCLSGRERPIVLMKKRPELDARWPEVAPGLAWLGVMLPYTPLHYLLFHEAAGRPSGLAWLAAPQALALVMTSANPGGEPLVTDNQQALTTLAGLADAFLLHDREIVIRCDDSVLRPGADGLQFIRRARGYTPQAIKLARPGPSVLAMGGFYKNTLCMTRADQAFLSQHIGDLDRVAVCQAQQQVASHLQHLLQTRPERLAHDLHPDFYGSRLALQWGQSWQLPVIAVQHHHAHIAAVLAEHHVEAPVLGLALDGVGLGTDGSAWGGELMLVDQAQCQRLGHLRPISLPGGDRAATQPWRMGAAALQLMGRGDEIALRYQAHAGAAQLAQLLARGAAQTTSMGRWFDALAGLLGILPQMQYEGQAAMLLESLAERYGPLDPVAGGYQLTAGVLDLTPLLARLADETDSAYAAACFHAVLVEGLAEWVAQPAQAQQLKQVACAGGCLQNGILRRGLRQALTRRGLSMLEARQAPPGDGGLALGQAWVAQRSQI